MPQAAIGHSERNGQTRLADGQPSRPRSSAARAPLPASPDEALLDRVPNPHRRHGLPRPLHRARIHLALPGDRPAGFRASRHRLRAGPLARRIEIAEALSGELPQPRRLPRGLHGGDRQAPWPNCSSRVGCASAATGIRAAAFRSTCSGRPASRRRTSGCRTRASRPIAGAAKGRGRSSPGDRQVAARAANDIYAPPL